ncbi:hypothetical protein GOODEAATRI_033461 [Goodea atripinnis]|uniref:Uncharacterized protein n=1 Tax=Goodea atripinnis TaxID=208336 RepID=A0ABV0Q338_9TELE
MDERRRIERKHQCRDQKDPRRSPVSASYRQMLLRRLQTHKEAPAGHRVTWEEEKQMLVHGGGCRGDEVTLCFCVGKKNPPTLISCLTDEAPGLLLFLLLLSLLISCIHVLSPLLFKS